PPESVVPSTRGSYAAQAQSEGSGPRRFDSARTVVQSSGFTIATAASERASSGVKLRPRRMGTSSTVKNVGETKLYQPRRKVVPSPTTIGTPGNIPLRGVDSVAAIA